jgi:xanthine dehydrogenase YagR molybdenum-binding subunit
MSRLIPTHTIGASIERIDGPAKVRGAAPYAFEHRLDERPAYVYPIGSTIARGRVASIDATRAEQLPGVLVVLTHLNAPRLAADTDRELWVLQTDEVWFRGQVVGAVVADSLETAREAAGDVTVTYHQQPHQVELRADRSDLYTPETVNPQLETDTSVWGRRRGDAHGRRDR